MNTPIPAALLVELESPSEGWVGVGVLHRNDERTVFETLPDYWELADRPVLGQVFEDRDRAWRPTARVALPTWFSHLLPEGRLRHEIARDAGVRAEREFPLLTRIGGDDLPGAVRVRAIEAPDTAALAENGGEADGDVADDVGHALKFSLAGVQPKFSLILSDHRGLVFPATGEAGTWIAKLAYGHAGFDHVPEAEFAGLELAAAIGIPVPEHRLVPVTDIAGLPDWARTDGSQALIVDRYDRTDGGGRVHAEQLAQVLNIGTGHERAKYRVNFETIARVICAVAGTDQLGDILDRLVLNALFGNGDAHAKNWSLVYPDGVRASLSPAYDIVPTVAYVPDDDFGCRLAGSKSFADISTERLTRLAVLAGGERAWATERIQQAIERTRDAWPLLTDLLPRALYDRITDHRDSLRQLR